MNKSRVKDLLRPIYTPLRRGMYWCINAPQNMRKIKQHREYIRGLKDIHKGQRCFVIGNGPSLTAEDLSRLENEICFASNRIYEIYNQTQWRPTYYCAQDSRVIHTSAKEMSERVHECKFIGIVDYLSYPQIENAHYLKAISDEYYPELPGFSEDISRLYYSGYTVTYMCIQLAVYMGFKEIILLGVDHNYSVQLNSDGSVTQNGTKDHFSENDTVETDNPTMNPTFFPQMHKVTLAFEAAEKYAKEHGIKIYNATRGGKLEVFERVDFDSLFEVKGKE